MLIAACADADAPSPADEGVVDVFTPYRGPEADAFRAVLEAVSQRTGIATRHVGTADFPVRLEERVRDGDAPDIALVPQPAIIDGVARDGQLVPLDDVVDPQHPPLRARSDAASRGESGGRS